MSHQSFCTFFDSNYAAQGLSLYYSLKQNAEENFSLYILCLDDVLFNKLEAMKLPNATLINLTQVESSYPQLLLAKENRSLIEYYFTLSPVLPLYILQEFKEEVIASLDADILFFSSPTPIFEELGNQSIYIVPHRFREHQSHLAISGTFNVQCQLFRNDVTGIQCLNEYKTNLVISSNTGVGVAPWNVQNEKISRSNKEFYINNTKIVFYHFHGFKPFTRFFFKLGLSTYQVSKSSALMQMYKIYAKSLHAHQILSKRKSIRSGGYSKLQLFLSALKHKDLMTIFLWNR